jgi:hypothetical protein
MMSAVASTSAKALYDETEVHFNHAVPAASTYRAITSQSGWRDVVLIGERPEDVLWIGKQWCASKHGLELRNGLCSVRYRELSKSPHSPQIVSAVCENPDVDIDDFATAYLVAVALGGGRLSVSQRAVFFQCLDYARRSHP